MIYHGALARIAQSLSDIAEALKDRAKAEPIPKDRREFFRESGRKAFRCGAPPLSPEASNAQGRTFAEQAEYLYGYAQASWSRDY